MAESPFNTALPGNPRYQPKDLIELFGYDWLYVGLADVEIAGLQVLGEIGIIPATDIALLTPDVIQKVRGTITTTQVDKIEREVTQHDVRAWIRRAQEILYLHAAPVCKWVHIPFTSYDPLDTGRVLQFVHAYQKVHKPSIREVVSLMAELVKKHADQIQIGRTHGQHALPITVGFWLATILNRILTNARRMDEFADALVGKISGAVGAYNAQVGLRIAERCGETNFEKRVLQKVGLKPATISTQILPPEPLAYYLFSCCMLSASLAQFGRDCRQLMRSEIAEVAEDYGENQVGSSTMAQKRNPITFENLEGQWIKTRNEFGKVLDTLISEHQRDLVGSSVMRDFPTIVVNLQYQLSALLRKDKKRQLPFLARMTFDARACQRNFLQNAHLSLAEPLYIALLMAGYDGDAHELINRRVVPLAAASKRHLIDALEAVADEDPDVRNALDQIPHDICELLRHPERYTGNAAGKAFEIATMAEAYLATYKDVLENGASELKA